MQPVYYINQDHVIYPVIIVTKNHIHAILFMASTQNM